jgi:pimeloyl-ACP methyl ester carboxylesterase
MALTTHTIDVGDAVITYDVRDAETPSDRLPLVLIGQPMTAEGFSTLASHFSDRTVVTYDQRGLGRSTRSDGHQRQVPDVSAGDLHAVVVAAGLGRVDVFGSSGGAVNGLAWVARHPDDIHTLVAHEPPMLGVLPDAERAFAAERAVQERYDADGWGAGMAAFIAMTMVHGELTDEFLAQPHPDPAAFGMPTEDDGRRDDPLLSGVGHDVAAFLPDRDAIVAAPTRVVLAAGIESKDAITWRTAAATADLIGEPLAEFPSHHGGFLGGEFGQRGEPEAFAHRLREVLDR